MSAPTDFGREDVVAMSHTAASRRQGIRILQLAWLLMLIGGWALVAATHPNAMAMVVDAAVFAGIGACGLMISASMRRASLEMEKKLRLELLVHNMELENMAMRDDLTHLFNRRYFFQRLENELRTAKGFSRPLCIILLDLHGLKQTNERHGHGMGDKLLAGFGEFLLTQTRASDIPARIGGSEFAIILPDTSESAADVMIARLAKALDNSDPIEENNVSLRLSASLGVSGFPWSGSVADELIGQADASVSANKRAMRHAVQVSAGENLDTEVPAAFRKTGDEPAS